MIKDLTIENIKELITKDESRYLELKQTTGELYKAMTSACAFLNTDGGWVIFGITPKLNIVGQNVTDPTRQEIANTLRKFEPAIDVPVQYIEIPEKEGFYVVAMYFDAPAPTQAPYTFDARPYYKVENTTAIMPREMFEARIRRSNPSMFAWEKRMLLFHIKKVMRL
jgi:ATP-dependent DNA helicase RecG